MHPDIGARSFAPRPESVTVIAWLLILMGCFGLLSCLAVWTMRDSPQLHPLWTAYRLPYWVVLAVMAANLVLHILCAVGLLMRVSWSRHVYLVSAMLMVGFSLWVSPWPQFEVLSLIIPVLASMFLYRPAANRWFAEQETASGG
jgi:hypothetical protein